MSGDLYRNRSIMAPMAGINTPSFCALLIENGCDFIYSGLLSAHALVKRPKETEGVLASFPTGVDFVAQIFGSEPEIMAEAAAIIDRSGLAVGVDINMGCPVRKVNKSISGAALMRDVPLASRVVRAVVDAVRLPVSVKIRSGWNDAELNAPELARVCVDNGAVALAIHPRTKAQGFSGRSDWTMIRRLKELLSIPVIGSGDIHTVDDAMRMLSETGCDSVMLGRGALGDPTLPARVATRMKGGPAIPPPAGPEIVRMCLKHYRYHIQFEGEKRGMYEMRKFIGWYLRGLPNASRVRSHANTLESAGAVLELLESYEKELDGVPRDMEARPPIEEDFE